jgi:hypothetical protein
VADIGRERRRAEEARRRNIVSASLDYDNRFWEIVREALERFQIDAEFLRDYTSDAGDAALVEAIKQTRKKLTCLEADPAGRLG